MLGYMRVLAALGIGVVSLPGYSERSTAQQNPVTAIDVALEPDATMIQHAKADNARLLNAYPMGFALDSTHNPHVTLLQQFVLTADLDKVYAAANKALSGENPTCWKLKAINYYYIPDPPNGLAGIVVEPTDDLHRLQQKNNRCACTICSEKRDPRSVCDDRGWPRHPGVLDRLRGQFCVDRIGPEIQPARHNRCRHRSLPKGNAGRAV
jgi:hypothetical protein